MAINGNSRQKELSIEQENAVDLLIQGKSDREVGELVGVSRQTVTSWRLENNLFIAALNQRRADLWGENVERLRYLLSEALDVVAAGLQSEDEKVKLSAAWGVLKSVGLSGVSLEPSGETTAAGVESEKKRAQLFDFTFG